ncbi:MAG: helix-turn-helix domain-containing protein, partial [Bryobacteraceae bacterium]
TDTEALEGYLYAGLGVRVKSANLPPKEVSAMLYGVSARQVTRMFGRGDIPAMRVNGKLWRTSPEIVEGYIQRKLGPASDPNSEPQSTAQGGVMAVSLR